MTGWRYRDQMRAYWRWLRGSHRCTRCDKRISMAADPRLFFMPGVVESALVCAECRLADIGHGGYTLHDPWTNSPCSFSVLARKGPLLGNRVRVAQGVTPEILHAATFLCWIVAKDKPDVGVGLLDDFGIIHRLAHWLCGCPWTHDSIDQVARDLDALHEVAERAFGETIGV